MAHRSASRWLTLADAVAAALQQERSAHLLHQIGAIVRGRTVDADADRHAGLFQVADRAEAGRQRLVAAGAVADGCAGLRETVHFGCIEMDAVGKPCAVVEPAAAFEIVERAAAVNFQAIAVLVFGFAEMGVQPHA